MFGLEESELELRLEFELAWARARKSEHWRLHQNRCYLHFIAASDSSGVIQLHTAGLTLNQRLGIPPGSGGRSGPRPGTGSRASSRGH